MLRDLEHLIDEVEELDEELFKKLAVEVGYIEDKIADIENECEKFENKFDEIDGTIDHVVTGTLEKIQRFRDYGILNPSDTIESLLDELTNDLNEVYYGNDE